MPETNPSPERTARSESMREREEEGWQRRGDEEGWRRGGDEEFAWRRRGGRRGHVRGPGFPGRAVITGGPHFGGPAWWLAGPAMGRGPPAKPGHVAAAPLALPPDAPLP